ncbi:hypothetical protein [Mycoplasmopsis bovis]|uniref:hypothetical protein n=2 Tax=Mycoplasmopsis bovis TaxID=28903 RepID=UPI003D2A5315
MFKVLCSNYKGLTYEKKINVNRGGGLVFASSFPMIAASCENKNPTDESIINNTTPQTQGNQNDQEDKSKEKEQKDDPSGSDSSSSNTSPQTQGNQNDQEDKSKEKEQKDDPENLLKQLEEAKKDYEKTKRENEALIKGSKYFDDLNYWFGNIGSHHSNHEWNYYSQFKLEVKKPRIDEKWLKLAKEFIRKYETVIKKDLKEKN